MEILTGPFSVQYAVLLPLIMGIFPFLGATKLHFHLKTSQYFLIIFTGVHIFVIVLKQNMKANMVLGNNEVQWMQ